MRQPFARRRVKCRADPFRAVEGVHADFDYPASIAGFVQYVPNDEPDLDSRDLNEIAS